MDNEKNKHKTLEQETSGETGNLSAKAKSAVELGTEAFEHAEQAVSDAYDKTSEKVGETYNKAKNYSHDNPGMTTLIALGIGVGLGFLLGASFGLSRISRIA